MSIKVEQDGMLDCGTGCRGFVWKEFIRIWTISLWLGFGLTGGLSEWLIVRWAWSMFSWSSNIETYINAIKFFEFLFPEVLPGDTLAIGFPEPCENVTRLLELVLNKS